MHKRFIFRLTYGANLETYLNDGEIRSKNHVDAQIGYRTSFSEIVARRGGNNFVTPCGNNVNEFVPFYFSPSTAMAYTINQGNVSLVGHNDVNYGIASMEDIVYIIADPIKVAASGCSFWFTDIACNSAQDPQYRNEINSLATHVDWELFDDNPKMGHISEIGYEGVCRYFMDSERKKNWMNRKKKRMAEFMVQNAFSMDLVECLVIKSTKWEQFLVDRIRRSGRNIPVLVKPGCYF